MQNRTGNEKGTPMKKRLPCILLAASLVVGLNPAAAFADTTEPVVVDGTSATIEGNVTVSQDTTSAVEADNGANVTVNGDVTHTGGPAGTTGAGVIASNGSTVTVGNVTTKGTDGGSDGVVANNGSTVTAGNVSTNGYLSDSIFASKGNVTARDVTTTGDDSWAVHAIYPSNVTVGHVVNASARGGGGITATGEATVTAESVRATGEGALGVDVGSYGGGTVIVKGDVTATGKDGAGIFAVQNGHALVKGDVTSQQGFGAILKLLTKRQADSTAPTVLVVEGTLSGKTAPLAIVPGSDSDGSMVFDLNEYDELPTIIVQSMVKGERWFVVGYRDENNVFHEAESPFANAFGEAIMNNVQYIVKAKNLKVDGAAQANAMGNVYTVAREGATITLTPEVAQGYHLSSIDLGAYAKVARQGADGSYALSAERGGNLVFAAEMAKDSEPIDEGDGESKDGSDSKRGGSDNASKASFATGTTSAGNGQGNAAATTPRTDDDATAALAFALLAGSAVALGASRKRMAHNG